MERKKERERKCLRRRKQKLFFSLLHFFKKLGRVPKAFFLFHDDSEMILFFSVLAVVT